MLLVEDFQFALERSINKLSIIRTIILVVPSLFMVVFAPDVSATDPSAVCDKREKLIAKLSDRPHFEREALVLLDGVPGQGHRIELFMNSGEGGRHSYTMLRTLQETHRGPGCRDGSAAFVEKGTLQTALGR